MHTSSEAQAVRLRSVSARAWDWTTAAIVTDGLCMACLAQLRCIDMNSGVDAKSAEAIDREFQGRLIILQALLALDR